MAAWHPWQAAETVYARRSTNRVKPGVAHGAMDARIVGPVGFDDEAAGLIGAAFILHLADRIRAAARSARPPDAVRRPRPVRARRPRVPARDVMVAGVIADDGLEGRIAQAAMVMAIASRLAAARGPAT